MGDFEKYALYIVPAIIVAGGIILGFIIERIVVAFVRRRMGKTTPHAKIAARSMRGIIVLLFLIIALYISIEIVGMAPWLHDFLNKVLLVLVIFSVTFAVARLTVGLIKIYSENNEGVLPSTSIFTNITSILIYIIGLMVILQHPDREWVSYAAKLPSKPDVKVALFTTYKYLTGSMFRNMYKKLAGRYPTPSLELKSRNGALSEEDRRALETFIS